MGSRTIGRRRTKFQRCEPDLVSSGDALTGDRECARDSGNQDRATASRLVGRGRPQPLGSWFASPSHGRERRPFSDVIQCNAAASSDGATPDQEIGGLVCPASPGGESVVRVLVFSTLYPNAAQRNHGVFVENRLRKTVGLGGIDATVLGARAVLSRRASDLRPLRRVRASAEA